MKNSEWGAVAYLAQSSCGRNGIEISMNSKNLNNLNYKNIYAVTGYSGETANGVDASTTTTDGWNEDYSYFTYSTNPFFIRGGHCIGGTVRTGGFAFSHTAGSANYGRGFRSILIAL